MAISSLLLRGFWFFKPKETVSINKPCELHTGIVQLYTDDDVRISWQERHNVEAICSIKSPSAIDVLKMDWSKFLRIDLSNPALDDYTFGITVKKGCPYLVIDGYRKTINLSFYLLVDSPEVSPFIKHDNASYVRELLDTTYTDHTY